MLIPDSINRSSEELLRAALQSSTSSITILSLDGQVIHANRVVKGLDIDKFIGSKIYDWTSPDEARKLKHFIESTAKEKTSNIYENKFVSPLGEIYYHKHIFRPLIIDDGVVAIVVVSDEISDLIHASDIKTLALESTGMCVWERDLIGNNVTLDDASYKLLGITENEFDGKFETLARTIIYPDDAEQFIEEVADAIKNKENFNGELRIIRKNDKSLRSLGFRTKLIKNEKNEVIRLIGIAWDTTEEKEKDEVFRNSAELERQNIELKQFAYLASHDLKAPLRTLKSYTDLLSDRYGGRLDDKANKYLEFISGAVDRLDSEIKALLQYSLIGEHQSLESVDIGQLIERIKQNLAIDISEFNCYFEAYDLPTIIACRPEMISLFQNLISNAVKFTSSERKCHIQIKAQEESGFWRFDVIDNGIGISEKNLHKIFTMFERLHSKDEYEGTGIGLAHCRKIVQAHEGKIWATSKLGQGSTFSFTIKKVSLEPKAE